MNVARRTQPTLAAVPRVFPSMANRALHAAWRVFGILAIAARPAFGASADTIDVKHLSLEQLMDIDVYSASRRIEPYKSAASAIYVLTAEEIRRARVTSIPEALRLVPGVQVARVDANKWAVSIRGFNSRTSNKLLVMIDGRSIYDPLFSGVLWEARDTMLENIERIEVIRGPGGTLWGANAVNGVINIVTKSARDTRGGLVVATTGTEERAGLAAREGWRTGARQYLRIYGKGYDRDAGYSSTTAAHDAASANRVGFRWDWNATARDDVRISGDYFDASVDNRGSATQTQTARHDGGNIVTSWNRKLSGGGIRAQLYYDRYHLDDVQLGEVRDTYDAEFQHSVELASIHQLVWGLNYHLTTDELRDGPVLKISPSARDAATTGLFVQDTIALAENKWRVTAGTKFERNDYTGTAWQPNVKLAWTPDGRRTIWASAARAVRVPSRLESDIVYLGQPLGKNVGAERLDAYEAGFRELRSASFWYDLAAFYNKYRNLLTIENNFIFENRMRGSVYGVELAGRWQPAPNVGLDAAYSWLNMRMRVSADSIAAASADRIEGSSPRQQLVLRSSLNFHVNFEFDSTLRFVDDLSALDVPSYAELDLGIGWFPIPKLDLSLVGQNLLHSHHAEQPTATASVTEAQRGVYVKAGWEF